MRRTSPLLLTQMLLTRLHFAALALAVASCAGSPPQIGAVSDAPSQAQEVKANESEGGAPVDAPDAAPKSPVSRVEHLSPPPSPPPGIMPAPRGNADGLASMGAGAVPRADFDRSPLREVSKKKSHSIAKDEIGMLGSVASGANPILLNKSFAAEEVAPTFSEGGDFQSAGINDLIDAKKDNLSTFAIDVDTGSYTLSRRFLENGAMPNPNGVRVEEWVNAFHYSYVDQSGKHPFSIHMEGAPLAKQSTLLRVGIQGKQIAKAHRAPVHLTFLVDVSGSMNGRDRLPLAKEALGLLIGELSDKDSVSLVTYAGSTGVVLPSTRVTKGNKQKIRDAIEKLSSGGGTAMGSGMELAYREAGKALGDKGISRVIVLSDGDANIGRTSIQEILKSIKGYVSEGVTMSTVGFGTGNYRDNLMEQLADAGNGNYSYVGSLKDAKKIFVDDLTGTLQVIAKDTKIQVEMNPAVVKSYRLIGYENRDVADKDFRNDKVDAGEIGAGHTVTALYEVQFLHDDPIGDIATVRVRYKEPKGDEATEVAKAFPASALQRNLEDMTADGRYAAGVALTAEVFRHSTHMERLGIDLSDAHKLLASGAVGPFAEERKDLVRLVAPLAQGAAVSRR